MWHRHSCLCRISARLKTQALSGGRLRPGHRQECLCHIVYGSRWQVRRGDTGESASVVNSWSVIKRKTFDQRATSPPRNGRVSVCASGSRLGILRVAQNDSAAFAQASRNAEKKQTLLHLRSSA